jgi:hypothetical protein
VRGNVFCEILEVAHEIKVNKMEISQSNLKELLNQIKELEKEEKLLMQEMSRFKSQRRLIQSYADSVMSSRGSGGGFAGTGGLSLIEAQEVLSYYSDEIFKLDELDMESEEKMSSLQESLALFQNQLATLQSSDSKKDKKKDKEDANLEQTRSVTVLINVTEISPQESKGTVEGEGKLNLMFSYVVSNATWTPSYDLRLNTIHNILDLSYFAEVTQSSGEDWNDCDVCLSTSNPAIGSSPPPLPTKTIDWDYNCDIHNHSRNRSSRKNVNYGSANKKKNSKFRKRSESEEDEDEGGGGRYNARHGSFALMEDDVLGGSPPLGGEPSNPLTPPVPSTDLRVTGNDAGSTIFIIPRKVTITSDNKPHKVIVTTISFNQTSHIIHYVSPSISTYVYLQSKTQNISSYPLLSSHKVSVFLDGNFASTTFLPQTSPNEYFHVFLGVDPTVKVQYMPCKTIQSMRGWLSINEREAKRYSYSTVIQNTKNKRISILIAEILPRVANDKITIELLEPIPSSLMKPTHDTGPILNEQDVIAGLDGFQGSETTAGTSDRNGTNTLSSSWSRDFVTQNKYTNNIVWLKTVQPGEKIEVKFSYRVTWPQNQSIGIR